jgi:hypothetical protein
MITHLLRLTVLYYVPAGAEGAAAAQMEKRGLVPRTGKLDVLYYVPAGAEGEAAVEKRAKLDVLYYVPAGAEGEAAAKL